MKKKLMLLGGIRYLLPVIKKAHELGAHVITADYLPDNIAHGYSDEYVNVSIMDKESVLKVAVEKKIDGIMSFACDPGVATAAYVAEKMGLPFQCSYDAAAILQDKGRFRQFLIENGFNCPKARSYSSKEEALADMSSARADGRRPQFPVIVKPVDSAGSKGCIRADSKSELPSAIDVALENGHNGRVIIEDFLTFESYHSSTDPFTVDGKIVSMTYSDQLFDKEAENPYTPAFIIWPSSMAKRHQGYLTSEIQRLFGLLGMKTGIYNIETVVGEGGIPYIMEVSPRGGGCKIAEIQQMAYGANLIENEIRKALSMPLNLATEHEVSGHWCEMILHARPGQTGRFQALEIAECMKNKVRAIDMTVKPGDVVHPFSGANMSLGDIFLQFESREELDAAISDTSRWLDIKLA